jgi:hypothetical protein
LLGIERTYGSIIKTFSHSDIAEQRRYAPPEVISVKRVPVAGAPAKAPKSDCQNNGSSWQFFGFHGDE